MDSCTDPSIFESSTEVNIMYSRKISDAMDVKKIMDCKSNLKNSTMHNGAYRHLKSQMMSPYIKFDRDNKLKLKNILWLKTQTLDLT